MPVSFLQRLKERKLVQWALAYLAGAWVLVEASNLAVERFHLSEVLGQAAFVMKAPSIERSCSRSRV